MILQRKITIQIEPRGDGGICIWSPEVMGLILSGSDPAKVMAAIWPALEAINFRYSVYPHSGRSFGEEPAPAVTEYDRSTPAIGDQND